MPRTRSDSGKMPVVKKSSVDGVLRNVDVRKLSIDGKAVFELLNARLDEAVRKILMKIDEKMTKLPSWSQMLNL